MYYFYYYTYNGSVCSGKQHKDTAKSPNTIRQYEITKDQYETLSLSQLAALFPFQEVS